MVTIKILILEDNFERIEQFKERIFEFKDKNNIQVLTTITDSAKDCIILLKNNEYNLVFLDHDLGGEVYVDTDNKNTGSEVARFLAEKNSYYLNMHKKTKFIIHSFNPSGVKNMLNLIKNSSYIPMIWTKETFHNNIKYN